MGIENYGNAGIGTNSSYVTNFSGMKMPFHFSDYSLFISDFHFLTIIG
jgi:hypothetical protein